MIHFPNMDIIHDIELVKFGILDELYIPFLADFFSSSQSVPFPSYKHLYEQFRKIEDLFNAPNFQWWDKFFLQKYLQYKISPRGFRHIKTCSFLSPSLILEWANISEFCTKKWIEIIIQQSDITFSDLLSKIQTLLGSLIQKPLHLPINYVQQIQTQYQT